MTKDEALDLALEALEDRSSLMKWQKAITAIKQALAAPVQSAERGEPVWCGHCNGSGRMVRDPDIGTDQECFVCDGAGVPAAPVQEDWGPGPHECHSLTAAPVQEPVAWRYRGILHDFDPSDWAEGPVTPLYTTPPAAQRQWVGLTDESIYAATEVAWRAGWAACRDAEFVGEEAEDEAWGYQGATVAQDTEAKLKEKNT
jgi:hypothetical protein